MYEYVPEFISSVYKLCIIYTSHTHTHVHTRARARTHTENF